MTRILLVSIVTLLASVVCPWASADVVLSPSSAVTTLGTWNGAHGIGNAINRSGLSASFTSGASDFNAYIASNPTHQSVLNSTFYVSANSNFVGTVDFDLGSVVNVNKFVLWQATYFAAEQIRTFTIRTSNVSNFSLSTAVGSFTATQNGQNSLSPAQVFTLTPTAARYVRLQPTGNYGGAGFIDLGEIALGVSPVPEVSAGLFLSLAGGIAGIVWIRRRGLRRS